MEAIEKIHEFEKFGSILGLERMNSLLQLLGNPQNDLRIIHVAGTNGKGSTCRYIYSVLQQAGYHAGLYTSPFLEVFNERIEFNGQYISDMDLSIYTERVLEGVEIMTSRGEQSPTEFEVITAIAFLYFKEKGADYVVLEVGLGGRGDSTNVCESPLVSVITSISLDHTDRLGTTLAEIAMEKCGIIKDKCPVITSAKTEEALTVIRKIAKEKHANCVETKDFFYDIKNESWDGYQFDVKLLGEELNDVKISMLGEHQVENAICALTTLLKLKQAKEIEFSLEDLYLGMEKAKQIGRFEVMSKGDCGPTVIIDGAHNPDGARALRLAIEKFGNNKKILLVTGMLGDKDIDQILAEFLSITKDFMVTEPQNPRKLAKEELEKFLYNLGGNVLETLDDTEICQAALQWKEKFDVILFAGSLYLIGTLRPILRNILKSMKSSC